jgi:uncharacterized protein (DUF1015 family)
MPQIAGFRGVVVDSPTKKPSDLTARDDARALYRYHQTFKHPSDGRSVTRKSFFVGVRLAPWGAPTIRATETIDAGQRDAALQQLTATALETEPVLAGYRDAAGEIERLLRRIDTERPTVDITVDDVNHKLWRSRDAELFGKVRNTIAPKKLQVLDGHARYDAMLAYQAKLEAQSPLAVHSSGNYGLMCLTALEDTALVPAARHRILRSAKPKADLLAAVQPQFIVDKLTGVAGSADKLVTALADSVAHQPVFVLVFKDDPDAWKLTLSPDITVSNQGIAVHRGIQHLDPVVVDALFLGRHATGATVTTETSTTAALAQLKAGADAVVIMRPVTVEQMIHVADLGQGLPPGAIALYPPVLPLVGFVVEPDVDLV